MSVIEGESSEADDVRGRMSPQKPIVELYQ
jgi:hypothetical protein